ncbi:MAG TPA: hypothetical protein PKY59_16420 [Pyrinomonadaceae bacterium]|nr:hypothetical protein [Pyrinomonadaceae bacterium]
MKNLVKFFLTKEEIEQLIYHITQIENILRGKLAVLSRKERSHYGSVKEKNKLLIDKAYQYRQSIPSISSPDVDWEEFNRDYKMRGFIESFLLRIAALVYSLESTKILHDYDNYRDTLTDYAYTQYKIASGESGYDQKADEMQQFFNRTSKTNRNTDKQTKN